MHAFWIRPTDMDIFNLEQDENYDPQTQFTLSSADKQQQGLLFDLLATVPAKWHSELATDTFKKQASLYISIAHLSNIHHSLIMRCTSRDRTRAHTFIKQDRLY